MMKFLLLGASALLALAQVQPLTDIVSIPERRQAAKTWRVRGQSVVGFPNNGAANTYINNLMQKFMRDNSVTQAQVSIASKGKQFLSRAYTWDVASRPTTEVDDVFLLASLSKMYCEAAVQVFFNSPTSVIKPDLKVYRHLGYKKAKDQRVFDITVQHLLDHQGGDINSLVQPDPAYNMREIALKMSKGARPATMRDIVEYKLQEHILNYQPGTNSSYSNYGYILLSYLVQNVSGRPSYYDYLSEKILKPNKLDVRQWLTDAKHHTNDRVKQIDNGSGPSALNPLSPTWVPFVNGGDGMYKESDMGGAALAASAATLTKTAANFPVWGNGNGRRSWYAREGSTPGARTRVESRDDGLDLAIVLNTRNFPDGAFGQLADNINRYLTDNWRP